VREVISNISQITVPLLYFRKVTSSSPDKVKNFHFSISSIRVLVPFQPSTQWVMDVLPRGESDRVVKLTAHPKLESRVGLTVPFFIKMSRVNFKSPAFSKYPSVFSLINAIWTERPPLVGEVSPTFADRGCHVVSVTDPYGRILAFLDRSRYFFFQIAPQLQLRG
jgi:hypothetical protein